MYLLRLFDIWHSPTVCWHSIGQQECRLLRPLANSVSKIVWGFTSAFFLFPPPPLFSRLTSVQFLRGRISFSRIILYEKHTNRLLRRLPSWKYFLPWWNKGSSSKRCRPFWLLIGRRKLSYFSANLWLRFYVYTRAVCPPYCFARLSKIQGAFSWRILP